MNTRMTTLGASMTYVADRSRSGSIAPTTAKVQRNILCGFAAVATTDPTRLTKRDVDRWLRTQSHVAAGTRRNRFGVVRRFLDHLVATRVLRRNPMAGLEPPKVPRAVHRSLDLDQARALATEAVDLRDQLVIVLALQLGLRRGELSRLQVGDVSLSAGTVLVHGKGGHERVLPLTAEAGLLVARYVGTMGLSAGPLLRSHLHPNRGVGPEQIARVFTRTARASGVKARNGDGVSLHSLRHTAATGIYTASRDVLAVRDVLGHQSLATTQIYVRGLDVEGLRPAMEGRAYLPHGVSLRRPGPETRSQRAS